MRSGRSRKVWRLYLGILVVAVASTGCTKNTRRERIWSIAIRLADGKEPSAFSLQCLESSVPSNSWWQTPHLEPLSDTLQSQTGQPVTFCGPANLDGIEFQGQWQSSDSESHTFSTNDYLIRDGRIEIWLAAPFAVQCIGSSNPLPPLAEEIILDCDWCENNGTGFGDLHWFTPGRLPKPTVTLNGWALPTDLLPLNRLITLRRSGASMPFDSVIVTIGEQQLCDTLQLIISL